MSLKNKTSKPAKKVAAKKPVASKKEVVLTMGQATAQNLHTVSVAISQLRNKLKELEQKSNEILTTLVEASGYEVSKASLKSISLENKTVKIEVDEPK